MGSSQALANPPACLGDDIARARAESKAVNGCSAYLIRKQLVDAVRRHVFLITGMIAAARMVLY